VQWNSSRSLCWCVGVFALLCVMLVLRGVWLCRYGLCVFFVVFGCVVLWVWCLLCAVELALGLDVVVLRVDVMYMCTLVFFD